MKLFIQKLAALGFLLSALLLGNYATAQNQEGFTPLIDGVSLSGWNIIGNANWQIGNGMIMSDKPAGFLVSSARYKNFIIRAEFWAESNTIVAFSFAAKIPTKLLLAMRMRSIFGIRDLDKNIQLAQLWMSPKSIQFIKPVAVGIRWKLLQMVVISK